MPDSVQDMYLRHLPSDLCVTPLYPLKVACSCSHLTKEEPEPGATQLVNEFPSQGFCATNSSREVKVDRLDYTYNPAQSARQYHTNYPSKLALWTPKSGLEVPL